MKETGILMKPELALLAHQGIKTNTRRLMKPQPRPGRYGATHPTKPNGIIGPTPGCLGGGDYHIWEGPRATAPLTEDAVYVALRQCPYGEPGDRIWVRETWNHSNYPLGPAQPGCSIFYRGDYLDDPLGPDLERSRDGIRRKWLSPLHLFRWASRTVGDLTAVKVERVQDISEADILAEGMTVDRVAKWCGVPWSDMPTLFDAWRVYWTMLHGRESWEANPWVWSLHFQKIDAAAA